MNSYEMSRQLGIHHSALIAKIMNVSEKFNGQVMKFERKSDAYFEMNAVSSAFMLLLLEAT